MGLEQFDNVKVAKDVRLRVLQLYSMRNIPNRYGGDSDKLLVATFLCDLDGERCTATIWRESVGNVFLGVLPDAFRGRDVVDALGVSCDSGLQSILINQFNSLVDGCGLVLFFKSALVNRFSNESDLLKGVSVEFKESKFDKVVVEVEEG